jgi:hypothetical protein
VKRFALVLGLAVMAATASTAQASIVYQYARAPRTDAFSRNETRAIFAPLYKAGICAVAFCRYDPPGNLKAADMLARMPSLIDCRLGALHPI